MSLETEVQSMINKESTLTNNKVANFCYEEEALTNPQEYADGVSDYDFERINNIPVTSANILKVNQTVLDKGFRSQASSITRMLVNHFFGRVSYNLNLTVGIFNNFLTQFKAYLGTPNGVATLDSNGRVPASQLPETAMEFKGTWNASTNETSLGTNLINGSGIKGDLYLCNTEGWFNAATGEGSTEQFTGAVQFFVNDRIVYDGATWNRLSSGDIQRVNGLSPVNGNVQLTFRMAMAEYNALTDMEKQGKYFIITDLNGEDWYTINDEVTASDTLWSSQKTHDEIISNVNGLIDDEADPETTDKTWSVSKINGLIDDEADPETTDKTWSVSKINGALTNHFVGIDPTNKLLNTSCPDGEWNSIINYTGWVVIDYWLNASNECKVWIDGVLLVNEYRGADAPISRQQVILPFVSGQVLKTSGGVVGSNGKTITFYGKK